MNFKSYVKSLRIIHVSLILGLVLFLCTTTFLVYFKDIAKEDVEMHNIFIKLVPLMMITGLIAGHFIFISKLKYIISLDSLPLKLNYYLSASITRYALIEGGGMFAIIVFLILGSIVYLTLGIISIILLLLIHPTEFRIKSDMELSPSEIATLQNPDFNVRSDL